VGTVHFTSSDRAVGLPADYTFKASDKGVATLSTVGTQTLTATDKKPGSIKGTASIAVS
jgi:hypothetical protein